MRVCRWCGLPVRWWHRYCRECSQRMGDAGIYAQSGGPAFRYMSRLPEAGADR